MAIYNGNEVAYEYLVEVAKACILAAARAPTLTGNLGLRTEIITGNDLIPMIDILETLGKSSAVLEFDGVTYRKLLDAGKPPPVLLLGADLTKAIGWNCGGCGFSTCAEFTKYVKTNKGRGNLAIGPSCLWKVIDFGIAADHACACAAMHRAEARIQFSMGTISALLGRLEGCSCHLGLPLGSLGSDIWFDRQAMAGLHEYEQLSERITAGSPNLHMTFTGTGTPLIKTKQRWWEAPIFLKIEEDKEIIVRMVESQKNVMEKIMKYCGASSGEKK